MMYAITNTERREIIIQILCSLNENKDTYIPDNVTSAISQYKELVEQGIIVDPSFEEEE